MGRTPVQLGQVLHDLLRGCSDLPGELRLERHAEAGELEHEVPVHHAAARVAEILPLLTQGAERQAACY